MTGRANSLILYIFGLIVLSLLTEYQPKLAGLLLILVVFALLAKIEV